MAEINNKKYLFEEMPINKALMTMAIPTIVSQLVNLIYNIVDTMFIGRTGDAYKTAAVTLAFTIFMMTVSFGNLFGIGGGSLIARLMGSGEKEKSKAVSALAFYGAITAALLYSLIIGVFQNPILDFLGASDNTLGFAKQYIFLVVVLGDVPVILSMTTAHLLRNTGYSKQAGIGLSLGGILNVILDPVCMFVIMPKGMEVFGAALATLISNIVACVYLVSVMAKVSTRSALCLDPREIKNITRDELRSFFGVGVPSALLTGLFDVANICLNALAATHGDLQLAAIGIVMKAERLPNAVNIGLCQGMLPIVAYNYSSGNHQRMRAVIRSTQLYGLSMSIGALILFEIFSPYVCGVFMNTSSGANTAAAVSTVAFATLFLRIRCIASPLQFLNFSTSFAMQAVGYGSGTMIHAVFRELIFYIPFMFVLNHFFGLNGLVSAIIFGEGAGAVFALLLFRRWKKLNVRSGEI
ncbi:MAG: cation transporter [Clostridiales bacterium]|nr:cation transporter [Clostridiales bacterium]